MRSKAASSEVSVMAKTLGLSTQEMVDISDPVFLEAQRIMIRLPSAESQAHDLSGFLKGK